jgi:hypothetical protein
MSAGDGPDNPKPDAQPDAPATTAEPKSDTIHIQSDLLPPGIKEGDMLKVTGMDENGCQFELVKGEQEGKGEDWESGFRKEMSALTPSEEAS